MSEGFSVAVVGATGAVGEAMIEILESRNFPVEKLYALASARSEGKTVMFKGRPVLVERLDTFDFSKVSLALFSAGGSISAEFAPKAAAAGAVVVDNTSHFRRDEDIPLVVPEVNGAVLKGLPERRIIANPNCSTIQMLVALKPLHDLARIRRIEVATYQAVSGAGSSGVEELARQTAELLNARSHEPSVFTKQIAFNVIPHIDSFQDNGFTREEMKMVWETRKILDDETILVNPTCVRVPVFFGHSEAVSIETEAPITVEAARAALRVAPGVRLMDGQKDGAYPTPVPNAAGDDSVFVGRLRESLTVPGGLNLWVVSDNVRKGAALNSVQIAEMLQDLLPAR
ncbi:MAG: aspartate-semialdehyde dehydrogenase [Pseudomonadales bacterium]|nr:aspartate-semialdehyde dehydrogenase [Pseudomonadales bacterium]